MTEDLVFIGPPGAGKGTVGKILETAGLAIHVSTGEMIREYLSTLPARDPLHARIAEGSFLDDDEITALLIRKVEHIPLDRRIIFDGYPRNVAQAQLLNRILGRAPRMVGSVILFDMPDEKVVERISGRYNCRDCGRVWHSMFNPAPEGTCVCGSTTFVVRSDDKPEVIEARLYRYHTRTLPLITHYGKRDMLKTVAADGEIAQVANAVLDLIS
jgi:adenylate kinase